MSDQDKIYAALCDSRLYDLPRELLVMLIENITKLNRDAFMQELVPLGAGSVPRAVLESCDTLQDMYACECMHIQGARDGGGPLDSCTNCGVPLCGACICQCSLCSQYTDYCYNCVNKFDNFGWLCKEHEVENIRSHT
jgi:hypothetical protein